jgi:outer membrane biosynthesis protein TonB
MHLDADNPRRAAMLLSAGLHLTLLVFALIGADWLPTRIFRAPPPIEVEFVRVADKPETPKPVEVKPEPKPEPPPEPPKAEPVRAAPPPPRPPDPAAEPAPAPKPKPDAQAALAVPVPKARPPMPKAAPREDSKAFDPERISALINKMRKPDAKPEPQAPAQPQPQPQRLAESLSISELDLIRRQFERCWNPPAGARDAGNLVVRVRLSLNPDGSLRGLPELVDRARMNDGFWLAAAESALRAVRRCEPLRDLPAGKYERWRDIELTFDPKDMAG